MSRQGNYKEEKRTIAEEIKGSVVALLLARATSQGGRFKDDDADYGTGGEQGPFASMQGLRSVFGAIVALADDPVGIWDVVTSETLHSLLEEWSTTLNELQRFRYPATPYDRGGDLKRIAGERPYVDSVSWALSTSVLINFCIRTWPDRLSTSFDSPLAEATRQEIFRALREIADSRCNDGGWNWSRESGLDEGHLYFTWSVCEGFADFYDYIMGESFQEIGIARDDDTIKKLIQNDPKILARVEAVRRDSTDFLFTRYLTKALASRGVSVDVLSSPADSSKRPRIELDEGGNDFSTFYFDMYLLEALILNGYDDEGDATVKEARKAELRKLYQRIVTRFASLRLAPPSLDGKETTMRLSIKHTASAVGKQRTYEFIVQDPGVWPQLVRTLVLYRFYTDPTDVPDEDIIGSNGGFERVRTDRIPAGNLGAELWNGLKYNLATTARSIEGLIDVYDYWDSFAKKERQVPPQSESALVQALADALYPELVSRGIGASAKPAESDLDRSLAEIKSEVQRLLSEERRSAFSDGDFDDKKLADRVMDAAQEIPAWSDIDRDDIVFKVIGDAQQKMRDADPNAYDLLQSMVWVSFATVVRLLPEILKEVILLSDSKKFEESETFRGVEKERNRPLASRIRQTFKAILEAELRKAKASDDPADYPGMVKNALQKTPAGGAR